MKFLNIIISRLFSWRKKTMDAEDREDLATFEERAAEPILSHQEFLDVDNNRKKSAYDNFGTYRFNAPRLAELLPKVLPAGVPQPAAILAPGLRANGVLVPSCAKFPH